MIANCQGGKPHPPIAVQSLGTKDELYFCILPCWLSSLIFHALTLLFTAWFTSLRTFGDSCIGLSVGRFTFDLKYLWTLISTINSWTWLYHTVQMRTLAEWARSRVIFVAYSFPALLLIASFEKTRNSQSKPVLRYYCKSRNGDKFQCDSFQIQLVLYPFPQTPPDAIMNERKFVQA